ncbi:hypothetical protein Ndes2526B_g03085 [Nannochloris sp. 'desiccata']|nr:hypothetical protein KSW81_006675 [Chlorella desiccata (nom. nud.)]KAH7622260.1 putative plastid-lipid-associated protein 4, chloroplastic [Chlorella desiccata (nom. nud.)]
MKSLSTSNFAKASQTTRSTSSSFGQSSASRRVPTKMIFTFGKPKTETLTLKKAELMENLKGLGRGADASEDDKLRINKLATELEKINPTKNVLGPELSAKWKLLYTTSDGILGTSRPPFFRPFGDIFQTIDAENLKARNQETLPFFNAVEAELTPVNKKKVNVQFKTFYILGLIPITAPESAKGELTITYLDDDLRISRGNKGNLFILSRSGKK